MNKPEEAKAKRASYMKDYRAAHPGYAEKRRARDANYKKGNQEKLTARYRAYRAAHKEELKAYKKAWRAKPENKRKAATYREFYEFTHPTDRRERLVKRYGLSQEQYGAMLLRQSGACAICRKLPNPGLSLCIDHDHVTGNVRGILCCNCNLVLGCSHDNPLVLRLAADYLEIANERK